MPDTQIGWIGQLGCSPTRYMLHIDGKHKLHHGKWMLVSIGTHVLARDKGDKGKVTHSYRPLIYMFVKQEESRESVKLLCESLKFVALHFYGYVLKPGVIGMDHSSGFLGGCLDAFEDVGEYHTRILHVSHPSASRIASVSHPSASRIASVSHPSVSRIASVSHLSASRITPRIEGIANCYPHLKRKAAQGEYLSVNDPFFKTFLMLIDAIHLTHSEGMMRLFIREVCQSRYDTVPTSNSYVLDTL